jgi:Pyocin activator protein PrtN
MKNILPSWRVLQFDGVVERLRPTVGDSIIASAPRIDTEGRRMNTAFLLMAQYRGKAIIPIEDVCRDYFSHLNPTKLVQKISAGEIAIPLVRMEASQKCAKGIHLVDLAKYLDARVEAARKEMTALTT